jgi:hypothetical protein
MERLDQRRGGERTGPREVIAPEPAPRPKVLDAIRSVLPGPMVESPEARQGRETATAQVAVEARGAGQAPEQYTSRTLARARMTPEANARLDELDQRWFDVGDPGAVALSLSEKQELARLKAEASGHPSVPARTLSGLKRGAWASTASFLGAAPVVFGKDSMMGRLGQELYDELQQEQGAGPHLLRPHRGGLRVVGAPDASWPGAPDRRRPAGHSSGARDRVLDRGRARHRH